MTLRVLEHEAAHVVAALHVGASVHDVRVINPRTTRPDLLGGLGEVGVTCETDKDDAFVCLAGYVWEATTPGGNPPGAAGDMTNAKRFAAAGGHDFDVLEARVKAFIRANVPVIRALAASMLAAMPKSGVLHRTSLQRCLAPYEAASKKAAPRR